jgi:hypothetical protein
MRRPSDVVASAPRGGRFGLWNQRMTVAVLTCGLLLLVADAVGLLESDSASSWLDITLGIAVGAWVVYWVGFVLTLRLELTQGGHLRWFRALRQGSIDVPDIDRISTDAAPFLWTIHHTHGRLVVAFVTDMKGFLRALDEVRAAGSSPPTSGDPSNAPEG